MQENIFLKQKKVGVTCAQKDGAFQNYKYAQWKFDRQKRQIEREYNRTRLSDIHSVCTNNRKEFWDQIKKLGPSKKNPIPMKVKKNDDLVTDVEFVCDVWKTEFENLYNRPALNQDRTSVDFLHEMHGQ